MRCWRDPSRLPTLARGVLGYRADFIVEVLTQAMEMNLFIWTIYDHPTDYPESFIARRWEIGPGSHRPTDETLRAPELTALQDMMRERGLNWLPRHESDDPTIVESWI